MICDILIRQNKGIKRILILLNAIDNFKFVGATLIPHITKITTQRQSVWENLYALFLSKMEENHMEETNVTMTAEEMQGEPAAKENETKAEKFIRIGEYRMNKAVDAIGRLENLANRGSYEYTQEQVDAMFQALEGRVAEIKARFTPKKTAESKTFSFGTTE